MKKIWWLSIFLLLTSGSCMTLHGGEMKTVAFRAVPNAEEWALGDKPAYLVITEKNWSTYYSSSPKAANFATSIYVVASLGMKPNPGYEIKISKLEQQGEKITIKVRLAEPDPKKFYAQVIVYPIAVVELAKAKLEPRGLLTFVFLDQKGREIAALKAEI